MAKKSFRETLLDSSATKKKSRAVTIRLPAEIDEQVKTLAKKTGRTITDIIIEALRFALEIRG